jgi:hypothetical protein
MPDDEKVEELWKWLDRELPDSFFTDRIPEADTQKRYDEIPDPLKLLAWTIIYCATEQCKAGHGKDEPDSCCMFRHFIFGVCMDLKDKGYDLHLPHYWFCDGVMVEPEWIVRLTNGLVKWVCDSSRDHCGLTDECRFYNPKNDSERKREEEKKLDDKILGLSEPLSPIKNGTDAPGGSSAPEPLSPFNDGTNPPGGSSRRV